jgi:type VI secretion system secreted protein Hcp
MSTTDCFLKVEGIPGESTDKVHKDEFELTSWSFGVGNPATIARSASNSGTSQRCHHNDFTFTKEMDKATALLWLFCCKGDHIPTITLTQRRSSGAAPIEFVKYVLTDSIITSHNISGGMGVPQESVSVNFGTISITYLDANSKDGQSGNVAASWDCFQNVEK